MTDFDNPDFEDSEEKKSRTQLKQEMAALQKLGEKLVDLNQNQLNEIPLEPELLAAIEQTHRIKQREARRRQFQFIGKLMRKCDYEAIQAAYQKLLDRDKLVVHYQHQAEDWRDKLLSGNNNDVTEFMTLYPDADSQKLRQFIRASLKEKKENKPPAHARKLFRLLRDIISQH